MNNEITSYNSEKKSLNNGDISVNNDDKSVNNEVYSDNKEMKSDNNKLPFALENREEEEKPSIQYEEMTTDPEEENQDVREEELWEIAELARKRKRLSPHIMEGIIVQLCAYRPLRLKELADMLERTPDGLRNNYLAKLLRENRLRLKYPDQVNHPRQAYITVR